MPSSLAGGSRMFSVTVPVPAATISTDFAIFIAPFDCTLQSASEMHAVLGTDGAAVSLQLTHDTGTQAAGAGADLLANNTNAGFNLKAAINTPQHAAFKSGASRKFVKGDRLSADWAGTTTSVAGVVITATFNRLD